SQEVWLNYGGRVAGVARDMHVLPGLLEVKATGLVLLSPDKDLVEQELVSLPRVFHARVALFSRSYSLLTSGSTARRIKHGLLGNVLKGERVTVSGRTGIATVVCLQRQKKVLGANAHRNFWMEVTCRHGDSVIGIIGR